MLAFLTKVQLYSELVKLTAFSDYLVDFRHIATIFAVNKGRDGRFSLKDLRDFCQLCLDVSAEFQGYEREMQLRATCSLKLYHVLKEVGLDYVQGW